MSAMNPPPQITHALQYNQADKKYTYIHTYKVPLYTWGWIKGWVNFGPVGSYVQIKSGQRLRVGSEHSLIPCGIPGDTILTPNLRVGLIKARRVFLGPKPST